MPDHGGRRRRSPARLLAPVALVLVTGAVGYVITTSTDAGNGDGRDSADRSAQQRPRQESQQPRRRLRAFYRVKLNDTLGLIAEKTDVPVERLEELNPELDPQNLIVGQRIRLRE
jgi:LysM repeat protein